MGSARERNAASPNQGESTGIRIMFTNARSIVNKIQELKLYAIKIHTTDLKQIKVKTNSENVKK